MKAGGKSKNNKNKSYRHRYALTYLCLLFLLSPILYVVPNGFAQKPIFTPQIPYANRNVKNKVFLEQADELIMDDRISPDYQILLGNVKFRKEGMVMYCDSAHFYEKQNSFDAFGNVRMEQGDTLFVFSDVLYYNGEEELARLRYNVKMQNNNVFLYTDSLNYSISEDLGYYFEGGRIEDEQNVLSSVYGQYATDTKDAEFLFDVELVNEKFVLKADSLKYNTNSHIATIVSKTNIVTNDTTIIYTDKGWYNTETENATLYNRSLIVTKDNQTLTGDTLYYDKSIDFGEAFGGMILTDSVHSTILEGDYGYHDNANKISFATKRARALEYSQGDTLYMHSDTIRTFLNDEDSTRILSAYHKVRFFRTDIQGIADSLSFTSNDTILRMFRHPVLWNETKQIFGNIINLHLNDSTIDWAELPDNGFMAEHIEEEYFNQLSGKEMLATFENGDLRKLDVNGNVEAIIYPEENDSTYNKLISAQSSFMIILFKNKAIEKLNMWPEVTGSAVPLFLAKRSNLTLPRFAWYESLRPIDKEDIFNISPEMIKLMDSPVDVSLADKLRQRRKTKQQNFEETNTSKELIQETPETFSQQDGDASPKTEETKSEEITE